MLYEVITLHYLKKAFVQNGVKLNVIHHRGSYALDMNGIECDVFLFMKKYKGIIRITSYNVCYTKLLRCTIA